MPPQIDRRFGFAWLGFGVAIAIHVLDEATHDFLAFYNPNARTIRERLPFLPLPTFTFRTWLLTLAVGIAIFLCLSPFAFRGVRRARVAAIVVAFLVGIGNAGLHILSSIYYHRWMPGVYSSPLLLLAAIFLIVTARSRPGAAANAAATH
ncbi:MAG: HXXEE domain-containing protein [Candidatus Angelobacter sp.]